MHTPQDDSSRPTAIDLFCGMGGLTEGLVRAGFRVIAAVDVLPLAIHAHRANHPGVTAVRGDLFRLKPTELAAQLKLRVGELGLLAACPPCQGFSAVRIRRSGRTCVEDRRNSLVARFVHWAEVLRPAAVMMENVPLLAEDRRFKLAVRRLERAGYGLEWDVLDAADYAVGQRRRRLVLIGLRGERPVLAGPSTIGVTVRDVIGRLPKAGSSGDPLHDHGECRSELVTQRIESVPFNGGSLRTLGADHQLDCHKRTNGFYDIYGRMAWDKPSPTITAGCINPSKGRFLHPEEPRAITLREAALLQGFERDWKVPLERGKYAAAGLIGNAIPPALVEPQAGRLLEAI